MDSRNNIAITRRTGLVYLYACSGGVNERVKSSDGRPIKTPPPTIMYARVPAEAWLIKRNR